MTFDQFCDIAEKTVGNRPGKIQGMSNIARIMDRCVFMGGPNLQNFDGKPYSFCSKILFSPETQLFFCLNFGNKSNDLAKAARQLKNQQRTNNCKVLLDDNGLFISTEGEINSGAYRFNEQTDIRVEVQSMLYWVEGSKKTASDSIMWMRSRINSEIFSVSDKVEQPSIFQSSNVLHPKNQILFWTARNRKNI